MLASSRATGSAALIAVALAACGDSAHELPPDAVTAPDASTPDAYVADAGVDAMALDAPGPPDATPAPDAAPSYRVRLTMAGDGRGRVSAGDAALCPGACELVVPEGTRVSFSAEPESGWMFAGWDGPCHGVAACSLVVDADVDLTATFSANTAAWARRWGGVSYDVATLVHAGAGDEITVAGRYSGQASFGGRTFDGGNSGNPFYVARYDGDGDHVWSTHGRGPVRGLAALPGGDTVVLVEANYGAVIEGQRWSAPVAGLVVARLDGATGAVRWGTSLTGDIGGNDVSLIDGNITVKPDGSIVVAATAFGTFEIAGHQVSSSDGDVLLAELAAATGVVHWATSVGRAGEQRASAVAAAGDGDIVVAGWFSEELTIGDVTYEAPGRSDSFLLALDGPEHTLGWRRVLGGGAFDHLAVDRDHVVAVGRLRGPVDLGGGPLVVIPTEAPTNEPVPVDVFVASLEVANGSHRWSRVIDAGYWPRGFGLTQNLGFEGVAFSPSGDVHLGGYLNRALDVAATGVVHPTRADGIVVRLAGATGVTADVMLVGGAGRSSINALAASPRGTVVAAGGVVDDDTLGGVALPLIGDVDTFVLRVAAPPTARR
jgi:hypothetical protein